MKLFKKLSVVTAVTALLATSAVAQDNTPSSGQMMDGKSGNMLNGDMSGMQEMDGVQGMVPMMQMMMQMAPMMRACTEMMEAMNRSMVETVPSAERN